MGRPRARGVARASPRLRWAIVLVALAAALMTAVAGAGLLQKTPPRLNLPPPADLQAFVLSTYDRMPAMPPVAITTLTDGAVKGRMYVDGSGAVRIEHYATPDAQTPDTYKILKGTTEVQLAIVGTRKVWVEQHGAISEDPRVFLLAEMLGGAASDQPGCGVTRNDGEVGNEPRLRAGRTSTPSTSPGGRRTMSRAAAGSSGSTPRRGWSCEAGPRPRRDPPARPGRNPNDRGDQPRVRGSGRRALRDRPAVGVARLSARTMRCPPTDRLPVTRRSGTRVHATARGNRWVRCHR